MFLFSSARRHPVSNIGFGYFSMRIFGFDGCGGWGVIWQPQGRARARGRGRIAPAPLADTIRDTAVTSIGHWCPYGSFPPALLSRLSQYSRDCLGVLAPGRCLAASILSPSGTVYGVRFDLVECTRPRWGEGYPVATADRVAPRPYNRMGREARGFLAR